MQLTPEQRKQQQDGREAQVKGIFDRMNKHVNDPQTAATLTMAVEILELKGELSVALSQLQTAARDIVNASRSRPGG